jgi:hypothetical protein
MATAIAHELAEKLREELDVHSAFTWEKFLREGLDAHFNARKVDATTGVESLAKPSDYWFQDSYVSPFDGRLVLPAGLQAVSICSKQSFTYGVLYAYTKSSPDCVFWVGCERGGAGDRLVAFNFQPTTLRIGIDGVLTPISAVQPSDYATAKHYYHLVASRVGCFFFIDYVLRAVAYFGMPALSTIAGPPYYILFGKRIPGPIGFQAFVEGYGIDTSKQRTVSLSPHDFRFSAGEAMPAMALSLYKAGTDTPLAGLSVNPDVTSHAIPVLGYREKTLYLRANGAGSVRVEVLTQAGNWREYYSDTVSANTLWWLKMTGDAALARLYFAPTSPPATITDAEAILSG